MNNYNILDCTFRDGGFQYNWNFKHEMVSQTLKSLDSNNVSIIELGYKTRVFNKHHGNFKYCHDDFIKSLIDFDINSSLAFMIDVKDFIETDSLATDDLKKVISKSEDSPFSICRIATDYNNMGYLPRIVDFLKNMGYIPIINLMKVSTLTDSHLDEYVKLVGSMVDIIYIADSLGELTPIRVQEIFNKFNIQGLHSHDNLGMAFANSVTAIQSGATYIDGTITGIGRGVGNTKTEQLVIYKNKNISESLLNTVDYFNKMNNDSKWGFNPTYMLSTIYGISPTNSQKLNEYRGQLSNSDFLKMIKNG